MGKRQMFKLLLGIMAYHYILKWFVQCLILNTQLLFKARVLILVTLKSPVLNTVSKQMDDNLLTYSEQKVNANGDMKCTLVSLN